MQNNKLSKLIALAVLLGGVTLALMAEASKNTTGIFYNGKSVSIGSTSEEMGSYSFKAGYLAVASGWGSVSLGNQTLSYGEDSFAQGFHSEAYGNYSVAMGDCSIAYGSDSTALSGGKAGDESLKDSTSVVAAFAAGYGTHARGIGSVAIGWASKAYGKGSVALGESYAGGTKDSAAAGVTLYTSNYAFAAGYQSAAIGNYSVAIGNQSKAWTEGSVAFGQSYAGGDNSAATTGATYAFAAGKSTASGDYSVAIGANSTASGNHSVAMGGYSKAFGRQSVAFGGGVAGLETMLANDESYAFAVGSNSTAKGIYSVAMGYFSTASGNYSVAMGSKSKAYGKHSVAFSGGVAGLETMSANDESYAFAAGKSTASGAYSVAMGNGAVATPDNSFAFGGTVADGHTASVALGYGSVTGGEYEVSVGSSTQTRKITNVTSAGTLSDDNNSAATGADVYGATYITDAHNYYDGSSTAVNVKTAVNAVDTAMGKLSANGNYILMSKNVYENIGLLDTKIGALSGTATYNYIAAANTVSANLSALDTRAKTNATAISTNATNITNNATNITNLTTTVGTNTTNISTLQGYFTSGVANEAAKATKDGAGNVIADTYAKTADVSSTYATKTDVSSTYATKTDLSTLSGTVTGYGTSITAIQTYVTASGLNANSQVITNVANGTADSHAVNYSQVKNAYVNATYSSNTLTLTKIDGTTTVINGIGGGSGDTFFEADSGNVKLKTASKITNVNDGTIASGSKEVVTGGQLYTTNQNVTTNANNITANTSNIATNTTNIATNTGNITTNTDNIATNTSDIATNTANIATNTFNITAIQGYVKTTGLDANSKVVANVANGTATNDAANLGQLQNYSTVTVAGTNVNTGNGIVIKGGVNVSITTSGNEITINATGGGGSVEPGKTSVGTNNNVGTEATNSTAMGTDNTVTGASSTAVGYGNTVSGTGSGAFGDPNNVIGSGSYAFGNDNTINGDNNFVLGNNVTVGGNVTNVVVLGNNSTVTESNVVSVGSETLQRKIVNVAPGENPYDAVNYAQYSDLANNMERRFSKVNEDIGRTGAASAALASLHPQMMRKGESQVMAGMGRYHGKSGAAVGLAWQPHKRVMLSGGFADAAGEIMFNVGASYKFGQHSYTPEQLAEMYNGNGTPLYVAELNAALKSKDVQIMNLKSEFGKAIQTKDVEIQDLRSKVDKLEAMMAELMKMKK